MSGGRQQHPQRKVLNQHRLVARETQRPAHHVGFPQPEKRDVAEDEQQVGDVGKVFRDRKFQQQQRSFF